MIYKGVFVRTICMTTCVDYLQGQLAWTICVDYFYDYLCGIFNRPGASLNGELFHVETHLSETPYIHVTQFVRSYQSDRDNSDK